MAKMNKLIIIAVVCFIFIVGVLAVASFYNSKEPAIKNNFPPETLEGCQKQRMILYDAIKQQGELNG